MTFALPPKRDEARPGDAPPPRNPAGHPSERASSRVLTSRETPAGGVPTPPPPVGGIIGALAEAKAVMAEGKTPKWTVLAKAYGVNPDTLRKRARYGAPRRRRNPTDWPQEKIDTLVRLWNDGKSAGQIALALHITRNAAMGQIYRQKKRDGLLKPHVANERTYPPRVRRITHFSRRRGDHGGGIGLKIAYGTFGAKPKLKAVKVEPPPPPPMCAPVTLMDRTAGQCPWPLGEPVGPATVMCGADIGDRTYCAYHMRIAYRPEEPRRARDLERMARMV